MALVEGAYCRGLAVKVSGKPSLVRLPNHEDTEEAEPG